MLTSPDAIGLCHFSGCNLSLFLSAMSLITYVADDSAHKLRNANKA